MNLYDFDRTIYKHDCVMKFYFFYLRHHIVYFWHLFYLIPFTIAFIFRIINLTRLKEHLLLPFRYSKDLQAEIKTFWDREEKNIYPYYQAIKKGNDVICSASPRFILKEIVTRINPTATLICSEVNPKTMKFEKSELNNKGENKVAKLNSLGLTKFEKGYSDSNSDIPMLRLCDEKFKVKHGKVLPFDGKYFDNTTSKS